MENINIYSKYYDNELFMIGALDCFGVPHTPDNINMKSYIDMIADDLKKTGLNINYVNLHSLGCNKTWSLKEIINRDYTKKEYNDINLIQTKKVIEKGNIFPYPVNSNFLEHYYETSELPNLKITSHFCDSKNPIFFYSCGQMNFHKYIKMPSNDYKQIIPEILYHFNEHFTKTMNDIKDMIEYLTLLNPSVKIYMFGVYPMFESEKTRRLLRPIYSLINKKVQLFFSNYDNVNFVDIIDNIKYVAPNDCHPSYEGQCYMKIKVLEKMNKTIHV